VVKEDHIRFVVKDRNITLTGIGFGMAEKFHLLQGNKGVDIVYKIEENEWQGRVSLQLRMIDMRETVL
jgi:single-stranded-DNA-specific exonuclease